MVATPKGCRVRSSELGAQVIRSIAAAWGSGGDEYQRSVEATVTGSSCVSAPCTDPIQHNRYDVFLNTSWDWLPAAPVGVEETFALIRRAYPFRELIRWNLIASSSISKGAVFRARETIRRVVGKFRCMTASYSSAHPADWAVISWSTSAPFTRKVLLMCSCAVAGGSWKRIHQATRDRHLFVLSGADRSADRHGSSGSVRRAADGQLPTVPRWNAAKMRVLPGWRARFRNCGPEGLEKRCTKLRMTPLSPIVWSRITNLARECPAIVELFRAQLTISVSRSGGKC